MTVDQHIPRNPDTFGKPKIAVHIVEIKSKIPINIKAFLMPKHLLNAKTKEPVQNATNSFNSVRYRISILCHNSIQVIQRSD